MRRPNTLDRETLQSLINQIGLQGLLESLAEECKIRSLAASEAAGDGPWTQLSVDAKDWADAWAAVCKARDFAASVVL